VGTLVDAARELPPLLKLLEFRARTPGHSSSDPGLPVDAEALEIAAQIREQVRDWSAQIRAQYVPDDLIVSFGNWARRFIALFMQGRIPESKLLDATITVESWVRMIRNKYDPPAKREWKSPCPKCRASVVHRDSAGNVVGEYFSSITVNVTDRVAECSECGERFEGDAGLAKLRLLTNVEEQLARGAVVDKAALALYFEYRGVSDLA
jgi:hypothetical protein